MTIYYKKMSETKVLRFSFNIFIIASFHTSLLPSSSTNHVSLNVNIKNCKRKTLNLQTINNSRFNRNKQKSINFQQKTVN